MKFFVARAGVEAALEPLEHPTADEEMRSYVTTLRQISTSERKRGPAYEADDG